VASGRALQAAAYFRTDNVCSLLIKAGGLEGMQKISMVDNTAPSKPSAPAAKKAPAKPAASKPAATGTPSKTPAAASKTA